MYVMKVCFRFFKLYFVNRKLKMWTKVVFFICVSSSSFTWVIVIACLRHVERFFFCQILASRFTYVQVVYLRWGDINWYESDRLIYFIFKWKQVSCCEHRFHTDEIEIEQMQDYFFWEKAKFIWSLCLVCMWCWKFLMKIVLMFMRYSETCMNFRWIFYVVSM